jgi:hypothetical protein
MGPSQADGGRPEFMGTDDLPLRVSLDPCWSGPDLNGMDLGERTLSTVPDVTLPTPWGSRVLVDAL